MDELKSIANKFEITNNNVTKGNNKAYGKSQLSKNESNYLFLKWRKYFVIEENEKKRKNKSY